MTGFDGASRGEERDFTVRRTDTADDVRLELSGELDVSVTEQLVRAAQDIEPGAHLTLDLESLSFMDSSGLRAFMTLDLRSRDEQWSLTLRAPQPPVKRLLHMSGFDERFRIVEA